MGKDAIKLTSQTTEQDVQDSLNLNTPSVIELDTAGGEDGDSSDDGVLSGTDTSADAASIVDGSADVVRPEGVVEQLRLASQAGADADRELIASERIGGNDAEDSGSNGSNPSSGAGNSPGVSGDESPDVTDAQRVIELETNGGNAAAVEPTVENSAQPASEPTDGGLPGGNAPVPGENAPGHGPVPSPEDLALNARLSDMKNSEFAQAVAKGRKFLVKAKNEARVNAEKKAAGGNNSDLQNAAWEEEGALDYVPGKGMTNIAKTVTAGAGVGLCVLDVYNGVDVCIKENQSPTENNASVLSILKAVAVPLILGVLLAKKIYTSFKKENSLTSYGPHIPELIKVLATITESVITIASKDTQESRNAVNGLAPVKSFCMIITSFLDIYKKISTIKKLQARINREPDKETLYKPYISKLNDKNIIQIPKIIMLAGKNVSEIAYAVEYARNPNSTASKVTKWAALGFDAINNGIDIGNSGAHEEWGKISQADMALYKKQVRSFSDLADPSKGFYLGTPEEDNDPIVITSLMPKEIKENALDRYDDVKEDLNAIGVTPRELNKAKSKEAQDQLIAAALGL